MCYISFVNESHKKNHISKCVFGAKSKEGGERDTDTNADAENNTDTANEANENDSEAELPSSTDLFRIWRKYHYSRHLNYTYFKNRSVQNDLHQNFAKLRPLLQREIKHRLEKDHCIKVGLNTSILMGKIIDTSDENYELNRVEFIFSGLIELTSEEEIDELLDFFYSHTQATIESYLQSGSNFILLSILQYRLECIKQVGLSMRKFQALPKFIESRFVIQIYNLQNECALLAISLHLSLHQRYRAFPKDQWAALLPGSLCDDQLELICGDIYRDLFAKSRHLFPLKSGKKNFENLKKTLGLDEYYFNVLLASEGQIYTIFASLGKKDLKGKTDTEKLHDFEQFNIDLLIWDEKPQKLGKVIQEGHVALLTNLTALIDTMRDRRKHKHFLCRYCKYKYQNLSVFLNHVTECNNINKTYQTIIMPSPNTEPGQPQEPQLRTNERIGRLLNSHFVVADIEIMFSKDKDGQQKLQNNEILSEQCYGVIMSACIQPLMKTSIYDTPEIRSFKTHFFEPLVVTHEFAIYDCLVKLMEQSQTAKKHFDIITAHYSSIRLTDEERQIANDTNYCMNPTCGRFLKPSEKRLHHCHLGSESMIENKGGGLHLLLCHFCNANIYRLGKNMVIYFHFASGFDFSFVIRTVSDAIAAGDRRFRGLKLLCKASSEQYLTWQYSWSCFECITSTKDNQSCIHSWNKYIFKDSFAMLPSSLSCLIDVTSEPCIEKRATFQACFPLYAQFLEKNNYLKYMTEEDILKKGSVPFLPLTTGEEGEKFLKSTEFISQSDWKLTRFDDIVDHATYQKCYKFWSHLKEYEEKENGRALTWKLMYEMYCLTDTLFLGSIMKTYILDTFKETGRSILNFLSLPSYSMRLFLDVAIKEKMPILSQYKSQNFHFLERSLIGGVTSLNHTRINRNNVSFLPDYDPKKPSAYNIVIDQNAQYSHSMMNYWHNYSDFVMNTTAEARQCCEEIQNGSWRYWTENYMYQKKDSNGELQSYTCFFIVDLRSDKKLQERVKALPVVYVKKFPRSDWMSSASKKAMNYRRFGKYEADDISNYASDETIDFEENASTSYEQSQLRLLPILSNVKNYPVNHRSV